MRRLRWAALVAAISLALSGFAAFEISRPEPAYSQAGAPVLVTNTSGRSLPVIDGVSGQPVFFSGNQWMIEPNEAFYTHSWQGFTRFFFAGQSYHYIGAIAGTRFQFFIVEDWTAQPGVPPPPAFTPTPIATATPIATPTPTTPYVLVGGPNYLPNCGITQVKGRIVNPDGNGRGGVRVKVSTGGWEAISNPSNGNGDWDVLLDARPKAGDWDVVVWDNAPQSPVIRVTTNTSDCGPNGSGRQVGVVDFKKLTY